MLKCHAALGPLANMPVSLQQPWHFVPLFHFRPQNSTGPSPKDAQTVDARCSKYAGRRHVRRRWETLGIKAPRRRFFRVQFNISFWFNFVREASVLAVLLCRSRWVTEKTSELQIRGGTILIPKNFNSGSLGYFGVIGTGIGIKGIVIGIKKESKRNQKGIIFRFQFLISRSGRRNFNSRFLNPATSTSELP